MALTGAHLAGGALLCFLLAYLLYSRWLGRRIFSLHLWREEELPAYRFRDNYDYMPASLPVLWGHHFSSIAGAAPIVGPAIAVVWGWLPALLWVVLGVIFIGAVHDFGALVASARHGGRSIGTIAAKVMGGLAGELFKVIIFLLVFVVLAVFAYIVANLFVSYPSSVLPVNGEILVAILAGIAIYRWRLHPVVVGGVALVVLMVLVWLGVYFPVELPEWMVIGSPVLTWTVILLVYVWVASSLPVWLLLQPRDYINSYKLILGLVLLYVGLFLSAPEIDAPALRLKEVDMPVFPFIFIMIACGAISGFHSLVASGTTAKQLSKPQHARPVGYGAMLGEASLAVVSLVAVCAGFASANEWYQHYASSNIGMEGALTAFVKGASSFLKGVGLGNTLASEQFVITLLSVVIIGFALTSLDTAGRIQRYIIGEWAERLNFSAMAKSPALQAFVAVALSTLLALSDAEGKGGLRLWPLFGSTNQLVGALALFTVAVWLRHERKNIYPALLPAVFLAIVTFVGVVESIHAFVRDGRWLLVVVGTIIGVANLVIMGIALGQLTTRR